MIPIQDEEKEKIIRLIHAILPNAKIILFGSYAQNRATSGSDIDLALDCKQIINRCDILEIQDILAASNIYHAVDIIDFNKTTEDLQKIINEEGIPWAT